MRQSLCIATWRPPERPEVAVLSRWNCTVREPKLPLLSFRSTLWHCRWSRHLRNNTDTLPIGRHLWVFWLHFHCTCAETFISQLPVTSLASPLIWRPESFKKQQFGDHTKYLNVNLLCSSKMCHKCIFGPFHRLTLNVIVSTKFEVGQPDS